MANDDGKPGSKSWTDGPIPLLLGVLVGTGITWQAVSAFHRNGWGAMIQWGSHSHFRSFPWWLQAPFGLVCIGLCLWALVAPDRAK